MTKLQLGIIFLFILGCSKVSYAQQLMGKNEIYNDWIKSHPSSVNCDTSSDQLSYDAKINEQIQMTIRYLRSRNVDTLLVLVNSHPGRLIADTCRASLYPAEVYFFWRVGGKDSVKKNPDKCGLEEVEAISSPVFGFFSQYQRKLEQEYIVPVILGARRQGGKIIYSWLSSSDVDEYVLYYSIHGHCKRFTFSQADITNKSSLFYSDNIESQVYKWFVALQKECKKMGAVSK
jgi:hypothetical protein